jgi:hypothetical protein
VEALGHDQIRKLSIPKIYQKNSPMTEGIYVFLFFLFLKAPTIKIAAEPIPIRSRAAAPDTAIPFFNALITAAL